jgi:lysyl-tRNA synthetase class 2
MFRRRYLDLVINPDRVKMFERKAQFWRVQREFLLSKGFIEVEVPVLEAITGGADASPFVTHHNALDQDFYLRISTELYQKRLIGAGFEKIYTFGPNFRNEGMDDEHLQEFYDIEWYWAYANFRDNMELVKELFRKIANDVYGKTEFSTRGHTFDLADEWEELDYTETIKKHFDIDIFNDSDEKILQVIKENNIEMGGEVNRNRMIDTLWKAIRAKISGPAFLINQPKFISPLAKSYEDNQDITERFQVIIAGSELGNGYSEINDPQDQLDRFLDQQNLRESGDDEAQMLDIDFVEMLEYGMPPTSGYGQSERVFWFLEDVTAREGTFFPQLRNEIEKSTKEIYKDKVKFAEVKKK